MVAGVEWGCVCVLKFCRPKIKIKKDEENIYYISLLNKFSKALLTKNYSKGYKSITSRLKSYFLDRSCYAL